MPNTIYFLNNMFWGVYNPFCQTATAHSHICHYLIWYDMIPGPFDMILIWYVSIPCWYRYRDSCFDMILIPKYSVFCIAMWRFFRYQRGSRIKISLLIWYRYLGIDTTPSIDIYQTGIDTLIYRYIDIFGIDSEVWLPRKNANAGIRTIDRGAKWSKPRGAK